MSPNSFLNRLPFRQTKMTATPARLATATPRVGGMTKRPVQPNSEHISKAEHIRKDGRRERAAIVGRVMKEQGLSLPMASKYVKENGLY
jgi:hypothetical protein